MSGIFIHINWSDIFSLCAGIFNIKLIWDLEMGGGIGGGGIGSPGRYWGGGGDDCTLQVPDSNPSSSAPEVTRAPLQPPTSVSDSETPCSSRMPQRSSDTTLDQVPSVITEPSTPNTIRMSNPLHPATITRQSARSDKGKHKIKKVDSSSRALRPRRTVVQVLDELEADSNWAAADIFICPPDNPNSDGDSDNDYQPAHDLNRLAPSMLEAEAEVRTFNTELQPMSDEDEDLDMSSVNARRWTGTDLKKPLSSVFYEELREAAPKNDFFEESVENAETWNPVSTFELFLNRDVIQLITRSTNLYAQRANATCDDFKEEEIRCFVGIMLVSGYNSVPSRLRPNPEFSNRTEPDPNLTARFG